VLTKQYKALTKVHKSKISDKTGNLLLNYSSLFWGTTSHPDTV